jgi:hypothetical protein
MDEKQIFTFYNENTKIGLPIFLDNHTDIVSESDSYFYNTKYIFDEL